MAQYFVTVHRGTKDPFNYPYLGKVQYFKLELAYHGFSILEHPDYPGRHRARFLAMHRKESIWSYIGLRYSDVDFTWRKISAASS